jgi:dipeptidyl aminopeptidase/acylaminoacyl peptidase
MKKNILLLAILSIMLGSLNRAQGPIVNESFSIESALSAPMPGHLTTAPNSDLVAWTENHEGVRNIWIARGPDYQAIQLTHYKEDEGKGISSLLFSPDEIFLIYVYGDSPNRQGEYPNPILNPEGRSRDIWKVSLADHATEKLAEGHSPVLSPDGKTLAFIRGSQVYKKDMAGDSDATKYFTIRGRAGNLSWSPDGTRLAFVSHRGDHSFIGVYSRTENTIMYLDPTVARDGSPVWSPDGSKIAFMRVLNEKQTLPFRPERSALPWSIMVCDLETNNNRMLWKADPGPGSAFRFVSASNQLLWGSDGYIVFPWEKTGWTHLYSVSVENGLVQHLTPGSFEVQFVSLSPDGKTVLYSSNQNDIDRQHIWQVPVSGGAADLVTPGNGIEWSAVMTAKSRDLAFLASSGTNPAHAEILNGQKRTWISKEASYDPFPADLLVEPQQVVFPASDGMPIHGQLFLPPGPKKGMKHPAVLFFHGGSRRQMLLGFHHSGYYHNAYSLNQYLASRGFVVLSVNYRSGIGYGMEFREALHYGAAGASEFMDVMGAGLYLQSRHDVDPDRIGLWGGSYGGYLTALGLARASDLFAAGVDVHGVHDWNVVIGNFVSGYQPGAQAEAAEIAYRSSPMAYIDTWRSPVLLIHGDDDRNVPFSETVDLVESLEKQGVYYEQLIFPDEVHGFLLHANWIAAYEATADFFIRMLGE